MLLLQTQKRGAHCWDRWSLAWALEVLLADVVEFALGLVLIAGLCMPVSCDLTLLVLHSQDSIEQHCRALALAMIFSCLLLRLSSMLILQDYLRWRVDT